MMKAFRKSRSTVPPSPAVTLLKRERNFSKAFFSRWGGIGASGELMGLLGSNPEEWFAGHVEGDMPSKEIEALIVKRNEARALKDFEAADAIRDQLADAGITIEDGAGGTTWRRSG